MNQNKMLQMLENRKNGKKIGIYSACSANEFVIEAVLETGRDYHTPVLIEATANQCNQFGGYTGMTPADFMRFVKRLAEKVGLDTEMLILGGDHLGPLTWKNEPEASAMEKAEELVRQYVLAGFTKIHIDTSMMLADDDQTVKLSDELIAARAARLAKAAEEAYAILQKKNSDAIKPVYVIGSEVPIPGGAQEEEDGVSVTTPDQLKATYQTFRDQFEKEGLSDAFDRVVGIVVQPGVEFGDEQIIEYNSLLAKGLTDCLAGIGNMVFEGHSTDYQTKYRLKEMVEDGIAILKVGPALTFAMREALFSLEHIERELLEDDISHFREILEEEMLKNPAEWQKHYHGTQEQLAYKRKYSLSDRCRYYMPNPRVEQTIAKLTSNLSSVKIPLSILSQYMPTAYTVIREKGVKVTPENLIKLRIQDCIKEYLYATI